MADPKTVTVTGWTAGADECSAAHPNACFICTLKKGHEGDHVAHTDLANTREVARWPNLAPPAGEARDGAALAQSLVDEWAEYEQVPLPPSSEAELVKRIAAALTAQPEAPAEIERLRREVERLETKLEQLERGHSIAQGALRTSVEKNTRSERMVALIVDRIWDAACPVCCATVRIESGVIRGHMNTATHERCTASRRAFVETAREAFVASDKSASPTPATHTLESK